MKWILTLVVVCAIGAGVYWYVVKKGETPPEYQALPVSRGDLIQAVTATGQLGPVLNVQVGSQISGIIKRLFVDYNSVVKSNQIIAEVDSSTYDVTVLKAEAGLANSKANMALAEVQATRSEELFKSKLISASEHDIAQAQLLQAKAQVQSDEATLRSARVQLAYCTIYAPVDGVVISRSVDVGQTVAASFSTPTLFVIANDLTKMQIDALVSEADIGGVAVGQEVSFSVDAYPYQVFRGKVNQIRYGAITNQNVINYDAVIAVSNPDKKLLPGMTANVSITIAEKQNALKVPNAALRFRPPEVAGGPSGTNASKSASASAGRPGGDTTAVSGGGQRPGGGGGMVGGPGGGDRGGNRGPGGGGGDGARRMRPERQLTRTVYVLSGKTDTKSAETPKLTPIQIKVGITDGISTEVIEGLEEGMQVVTGMIMTGDAAARPGTPAANPFGGGGGGPFRRF